MWNIIRNYALPEYWTFWGLPAGALAIAALGLCYATLVAKTREGFRAGILLAACAVGGGFLYGLGGLNRDGLCAAQVAAYEAEFVKMEDKLNAATAKHAAELAGTIKTVEQDHEQKLIQIKARLAESESGSCVPSDEFLDSLRSLRSKKGDPAGKR